MSFYNGRVNFKAECGLSKHKDQMNIIPNYNAFTFKKILLQVCNS